MSVLTEEVASIVLCTNVAAVAPTGEQMYGGQESCDKVLALKDLPWMVFGSNEPTARPLARFHLALHANQFNRYVLTGTGIVRVQSTVEDR